MHLIVYISEYLGDREKIDQVLEEISQRAKIKNAARQITGVLFYHNGHFIQFIEGEATALRELMREILEDSRHTDLSVLVDEEVKQRGFEDWNMDCFNLSDQKKLDRKELQRILDAYRQMLEVNSHTLVMAYRTLLQHGVFEDAHEQDGITGQREKTTSTSIP